MHIYFSLLITVLSESAVFTVHVILYSFQVPKKTNTFNKEHTLIIKKSSIKHNLKTVFACIYS